MKRMVEFTTNRYGKRFAVNPLHVMYVEEIEDGVSHIALPVSSGEVSDFGAHCIRVKGSFDEVSSKLDTALDEIISDIRAL